MGNGNDSYSFRNINKDSLNKLGIRVRVPSEIKFKPQEIKDANIIVEVSDFTKVGNHDIQ